MKHNTRNASIIGAILIAAAAPLAAQQDGEQPATTVEAAGTAPAAESAGESSTMDNIVEKGKELMDAGAETAQKGWQKTKEVSGEVWEDTKEVSGEAWDKTKEVSGKAVEATKETAAKVGAAAKAGYQAAKETYVAEGDSEAAGTAGTADSSGAAEPATGTATQ